MHDPHPRSGPLHAVTLAVCLALVAACGSAERAAPGGAAGDIQARVAQTLADPDPLERAAGIATLLRDLPASALEDVLAGYRGAFLAWGDTELVLLAVWWARFDPEAAQRWSTSEWRSDHPRVAMTVMRAMARKDPQLALRHYFDKDNLIPGQGIYSDALEAIVIGWYESDQPGLLDFIKTQPSSQLRQQTLGTLARLIVFEHGGQGAIEWAEARAAEDGTEIFGRQLFQRIAASVAQEQPELAAEWVTRQVAQGAHPTLPRRVSTRWVEHDPEAALLWLENFEDSNHRQSAVAETWNLWLRADPQAARQWLFAQGDAIYGFLAPALARSIQQQVTAQQQVGNQTDYLEHLSHSLRIEDPDIRWGSVSFVARFWRLENESAAEAWMEEHAVPENFRLKVRGPLPGGLRQIVSQQKAD